MRINHFLRKNNKIIIYLILVFIAIIPCIIMFNKGYIWCHDNAFHYAQIQDLYDSIRSGNFNYYLNYETANYLGVGVRLMYGSFSHLITALIGIIIIPFGMSLTAAMKIVIMISMIISSIYTYKLAYKITNSQVSSILSAALFVLFPYRFCLIYVRNAYAETLALSIVPIVFLGVYEIINNYSSSRKPYFRTIIGMTLLILTHNITAFYTAIFVIVYALCSFNKLYKHLKDKNLYLNILCSIIFILTLSSWFLLPLLESKKTGLYRVFDSEAMRTGLDAVISSSKSSMAYFTCGLNFKYFNNFFIFSLLGISLSASIAFLSLYFEKRSRRNLIILVIFIISFVASFVFSFFCNVDYVVYSSMVIVLIAYFSPFKTIKAKNKWQDLIVFGFLSVLVILLIFCGQIWKALPSIFYNIQFSWRLFGFLGLFLAIFIGILFSILEKRMMIVARLFSAVLVGILFVIMKPISTNEYNYSAESNWNENYSIKKEDTYYMYSTGWQLEYFTTDFFASTPKSKFWWEIYSNYLANEKKGDPVDHPGLIFGNASFSNYNYNNGVITFKLDNKTESIVEVARVYYKGYHILIKDNAGVIHELEAFNNESYVAFKTNLSGEVTIYYKKTPTMTAGIYISYIAFVCLASFILKSYDYETKWN